MSTLTISPAAVVWALGPADRALIARWPLGGRPVIRRMLAGAVTDHLFCGIPHLTIRDFPARHRHVLSLAGPIERARPDRGVLTAALASARAALREWARREFPAAGA